MHINNLDVLIVVGAFIFFRLCWTSVQIDRCQIRIMNEGGHWVSDCIGYREIVFKIWKWRLRHFRR